MLIMSKWVIVVKNSFGKLAYILEDDNIKTEKESIKKFIELDYVNNIEAIEVIRVIKN